MKYRVVQWGTGGVGEEALRMIIDSPDLELVAVKCHSPEKDGVDAGRLAGRQSVGVHASSSADNVLSQRADCVLYMPRDTFDDPTVSDSTASDWVHEVEQILAAGTNVISPLQTAMHWRQLANGESLRARFEEACLKGGSSLFFTGLDPGFVSDCLAITLASAAAAITQVRTLEVIDYETYASSSTLESMGFGKRPEDLSGAASESFIPGWGCAAWLVADSLGVVIDDLVLEATSFASPDTFTTPGGLHVAEGTVGAIQWSLTAMVGDVPLIVARHVGRIGTSMAPDWPQIGSRGGYLVEVDGTIPLRLELPLGLIGGTGTCLGDAVHMTAARCVNAIAAVVNAAPGYHLLTGMPIAGGRHAVKVS